MSTDNCPVPNSPRTNLRASLKPVVDVQRSFGTLARMASAQTHIEPSRRALLFAALQEVQKKRTLAGWRQILFDPPSFALCPMLICSRNQLDRRAKKNTDCVTLNSVRLQDFENAPPSRILTQESVDHRQQCDASTQSRTVGDRSLEPRGGLWRSLSG